MSERTPLSRYGLWLALALTVGATLWSAFAQPEAEVAQAAPRAGKPPADKKPAGQVFGSGSRAIETGQDDASLDIAKLAQRTSDEPILNLFNIDKAEPALSEQAQAAPPSPQAPVLPFTYAGKLVNNGQLTVFISEGNLNYSVREGDVIGPWQVKRMEPPRMIMSYRPMKIEVPMMIGDIN